MLCAAPAEPTGPRACAPQQERPGQRGAHAMTRERPPLPTTGGPEKAHAAVQTQHSLDE